MKFVATGLIRFPGIVSFGNRVRIYVPGLLGLGAVVAGSKIKATPLKLPFRIARVGTVEV